MGEIYEVKISKLTDFGAFAELDAGIAGLIHTSEIKHLNKNAPKTLPTGLVASAIAIIRAT